MGLYCELEDLQNESDVEQKFLYQFLSSDSPMGLGLAARDILTKADIRKVTIGKGNQKKVYYPDYVISLRGIPVLVLEAKAPTVALEVAYSEARLYASEINSRFEHNLNVCKIIVVSNGAQTWAGYSDTAEPRFIVTFEEFAIENSKFSELLNFCSKRVLQEIADEPYKKRRGSAYFATPVSNLGGRQVQNEELEQNEFGRTLVFENSKIFGPETEQERCDIVDNAYVPSARREQHADPMYKEIRKFEFPRKNISTALPTDDPKDLVNSISTRIDNKKEAYSLMLIVGNVGSGKTTFVRWFKRKYLELKYPELASRCEWVFMDMNMAPNTSDEIYKWIKENFLISIEKRHQDITFTNLDILEHIFRKELTSFENGIGKLIASDQQTYNLEKFKILRTLSSDSDKMLTAIINYLRGDLGLVPIIVLDNCDKRDRDTQLLMFDVAQWLRSYYKCIVILPMRDSTYDMYKDEKPLDTIIKDLVFRIDPPDLLKVLQARLEYISRVTTSNKREYTLSNGIVVKIGNDELVNYYRKIMYYIRNSEMIKNIFFRLSDRNTRKGIEMFEDLCKSGHITSDEIFRIRASEDKPKIPEFKFLNAILRKNRKFYNGDESNFINLFGSDFHDDFPDPFIRMDILICVKDFRDNRHRPDFYSLMKYNDLIHEMEILGHEINVIKREINYLIRKGLLYTETQLNAAYENNSVMITIPGMLHLTMLNKVTYLAACAENVYYKNTDVVYNISSRLLTGKYLSKTSMVLNALDLIRYLEVYRKEYFARPNQYIQEGKYRSIFDLGICNEAIARWLENNSSVRDTLKLMSAYSIKENVQAKVIKKQKGSIMCLINGVEGHRGFLSIHGEKYHFSYENYQQIHEGSIICCVVMSFDIEHESFQLKYINTVS